MTVPAEDPHAARPEGTALLEGGELVRICLETFRSGGGRIEGFQAAERRKDLRPFLEMRFSDPSLVTRDMVEDVPKDKRLDGVTATLRSLADGFAPGRPPGALLPRPHRGLRRAGAGDRGDGRPDRSARAEGLPAPVAVHRYEGKGHMPHIEAAADVNARIKAIAEI